MPSEPLLEDLAAYDYYLPEAAIAQNPLEPRDQARLLVVSPHQTWHGRCTDLPQILGPGDLLVFNDTRVIPARLFGQRPGGKPVEILLLEVLGPREWLALVKPGRQFAVGAVVFFTGGRSQVKATVTRVDQATGGRVLEFELIRGESLTQALEELGQVPLPPYITHSQARPDQYQTIYAAVPGAVAAPTAGLHFTEDLLRRLSQAGVGVAFITLHVGLGTFRPVTAADLAKQRLHQEWCQVSAATVEQIQSTQVGGGRVIAVGTTTARALEAAAQGGELRPLTGKTDLLIQPGYRWRVVQGLMTNFHLPRSSLMLLVSSLIGRERLLELYNQAREDGYRFYSFGDAMLILP